MFFQNAHIRLLADCYARPVGLRNVLKETNPRFVGQKGNHKNFETTGKIFMISIEKMLKNNKDLKMKPKPKVGTNTSWGNVADWYDDTIEREGSYQRDLILPNLLRLAAIKPGEKIIDIACGQGFFSRELSKAGAIVTGADISSELIKIARGRSPFALSPSLEGEKERGSEPLLVSPLKRGEREFSVNYFVAPADILPLKDGEFDKAIIVLALQDIENLSGVIGEASRVLKSGGEFFIVINHPIFRIPKRTAWFYDEKRKIQSRVVDEYMSEARVKMEVHPGSDKTAGTISFHRPLQTYFKAFQKAGFAVTRLEEWVSTKQSEPGPRAQAENKARREFPMFMAIVVRKI